MTDPALAALAVEEAFYALGNERFEAEGGTFIRNRERPDIWDDNHVTGVTASTQDEIERLLERADREFAGSTHRLFYLDFRTPPMFEARLALEGYKRSDVLVLLLEGEPSGRQEGHEIRPVESEGDWRAYVALHDIDWREYVERMPDASGYDEGTAEQMMRSRRAKWPPVRHWLAYVDGEPRAYVSSWGGVDGVGYVEDLFTHPQSRGRGLARALLHHGIAEARRDGAGPVVIGADPSDTPKQMYAVMGFRPVAVKRSYLKRL